MLRHSAGRWLGGRWARAERAGGRAWARGRAERAVGRAGVGRRRAERAAGRGASGRSGRSGRRAGGRRANGRRAGGKAWQQARARAEMAGQGWLDGRSAA